VATRRRTTARRTTRSSTGYSTGYYRRRRPSTASTLGGAVALGAIALLGKFSWPQRIGLAVAVLVIVVGYELWTRRGQIAAEITQQQAADAANQPASGQPAAGQAAPGQPGPGQAASGQPAPPASS